MTPTAILARLNENPCTAALTREIVVVDLDMRFYDLDICALCGAIHPHLTWEGLEALRKAPTMPAVESIPLLPTIFVLYELAIVNGRSCWIPTLVTASQEAVIKRRERVHNALPKAEVLIRRIPGGEPYSFESGEES